MMTFYTAVGSYRLLNENGHKVPYIQKLGKLHAVSIPEFVIWCALLWEVMTYQELQQFYDIQMKTAGVEAPTLDELLGLMEKRRLITEGVGYTGVDALYSMLADAFIVPVRFYEGKRFLGVAKLILQGKLKIRAMFELKRSHSDSADSLRIMNLINQTPLNTAEIVKCIRKDIYDLSDERKLLDQLYPEDNSDQWVLMNEERYRTVTREVLMTVANLYLSRRVILELPI